MTGRIVAAGGSRAPDSPPADYDAPMRLRWLSRQAVAALPPELGGPEPTPEEAAEADAARRAREEHLASEAGRRQHLLLLRR